MSCIIDMVIVMASATVLINVYAPGMTHAPNNTSASSKHPHRNVNCSESHRNAYTLSRKPPYHPPKRMWPVLPFSIMLLESWF